MKKKNDTKKEQPTFVDELLKNGTTTITAKTCEELAEMVNQIPADCSYGAGAVGRDRETGMWSLRIDKLEGLPLSPSQGGGNLKEKGKTGKV